MNRMLDPYEATRLSPLGFWSKADGARYVAYCIWTLRCGTLIDPAPIGGDIGGAKDALFWGWLRESSLALELIIKTVLAEKERLKDRPSSVPSSHNVSQLWKMADLPKTSWEQEYHLRSAHLVLQWFGRYSAPRKGGIDLFEMRDSLRPRVKLGNGQIPKPITMGWENFDTLYQTAQSEYFSQREDIKDDGC